MGSMPRNWMVSVQSSSLEKGSEGGFESRCPHPIPPGPPFSKGGGERLRRMVLLHGFTLIEVLVALLVLSVGLLGLAGLQVRALQYTQASYQRTLVNIQALDMVERMWTNLADPLVELAAWQQLNRGSLPEWQGMATAVAGQAGAYEITISWNERRLGNAGAVSFSYPLMLPQGVP